MEMLKLIYTEE